MSPSCPISQKRIDTNMVRVISSLVVLFTLLFCMTQMLPFILVVLFDFAMRVLGKERFSPFALTAKFIVDRLKLQPEYTDESPKRFARYLGLGMTVLIVLLAVIGFTKAAVAIGLILIICAFLEVLFDFCIGCKLYYTLQLIKVIKHDRNFN